jgi:two-component system OmpR family response regulator
MPAAVSGAAGAAIPIGRPVSWREPMAQLRSELEAMAAMLAELAERARRETAPEAEVLSAGGWTLDGNTRELRSHDNGAPLAWKLTASEFRLVHALMESAGRTVRREALMRRLYDGAGNEGQVRNVDSLLSKLRRRLGGAASVSSPIETVRGVGCRWKEARCQPRG